MLDVINQQGAQVEALKEKVRQQQIVITLLANQSDKEILSYDAESIEAARSIEDVTWTQSEDGTITVHIRRFNPYNNGSKK